MGKRLVRKEQKMSQRWARNVREMSETCTGMRWAKDEQFGQKMDNLRDPASPLACLHRMHMIYIISYT